jgi:hypothetical protein
LLIAVATACGSMMNTQPALVALPPGATLYGHEGVVAVSKKQPHQVVLADGSVCVLASNLSVGYILADVFLTGLIGIAVDAVTNDWRTLDAGGCPGVIVN